MKYTVLLVLFVAGFIGGVMFFTQQHDTPMQWCPKGQKAVVVGSGRDVTGTITVLYGCER